MKGDEKSSDGSSQPTNIRYSRLILLIVTIPKHTCARICGYKEGCVLFRALQYKLDIVSIPVTLGLFLTIYYTPKSIGADIRSGHVTRVRPELDELRRPISSLSIWRVLTRRRSFAPPTVKLRGSG